MTQTGIPWEQLEHEGAWRLAHHALPDPAADAFPTRPEEETPAHGLYFSSLGPLEVRCAEGGFVELGPPQRRALLLRLLAEDCRPVSV
ncbi:hypothetical protein, partial [Streptomyces sp. NPDC060022]|uniref:hypothetical protein n=1 Tax=Streptomyces sp. NPDC060022 TaxID=3347039 RepID=UPI0036BDC2AE